jgi:hypothetical protein
MIIVLDETAEAYQFPLSWSESGPSAIAGVLGLEPRLTEPESVGLPITLYPTGVAAGPSYPSRHKDRLYCKSHSPPNRSWPRSAAAGRLSRGSAEGHMGSQLDQPCQRIGQDGKERKPTNVERGVDPPDSVERFESCN